VVVKVSGVLSARDETFRLFGGLYADVKRKPRPRGVVLDLTRVDFIDSLALGLIVGLYLECQETGIGFGFGGMSKHVKKLLKGTRLYTFLAVDRAQEKA